MTFVWTFSSFSYAKGMDKTSDTIEMTANGMMSQKTCMIRLDDTHNMRYINALQLQRISLKKNDSFVQFIFDAKNIITIKYANFDTAFLVIEKFIQEMNKCH